MLFRVFAFAALFSSIAHADAFVSWGPSFDSRVEGYLLEINSQASYYSEVLDVGASSGVFIGDLPVNENLFFRVRAYGSGLLSAYSETKAWRLDAMVLDSGDLLVEAVKASGEQPIENVFPDSSDEYIQKVIDQPLPDQVAEPIIAQVEQEVIDDPSQVPDVIASGDEAQQKVVSQTIDEEPQAAADLQAEEEYTTYQLQLPIEVLEFLAKSRN